MTVPDITTKYHNPTCPNCGDKRVRVIYETDDMIKVIFYDCIWCSHTWKPDEK